MTYRESIKQKADDCAAVVAGHDGSRVLLDRKNPRVEIEITRMEE